MKRESTSSHIALAASWLVMTALFCAYAFAAVGWHEWQVGTLVVAWIAWDVLSEKSSKRWLLTGGLVGVLGGFLSHLFFFDGPGVSPRGVALMMPFAAFFIGIGLRVYYLERGQERHHAA